MKLCVQNITAVAPQGSQQQAVHAQKLHKDAMKIFIHHTMVAYTKKET